LRLAVQAGTTIVTKTSDATLEKAVARQRAIQDEVAKADKAKKAEKSGKTGPMQAGARKYPGLPLPKQHQKKPGYEEELKLAPMYDAPFYKGSEKLKGNVALITGGDSGIGRAVAVLFAREGANVAITHLAEDEDAEVTRKAVEAEGSRCFVVAIDVTGRDACRKAVHETIREFGGLNILVNNAAFQVHAPSLDMLSEAHFDETLKTNLYGYYFMAQAALEHMKEGDAIINTGSVTGIRGSGELLDYSMTKGGIHAFTRSLASNLVPRGIRVNCVVPGPVWTPLNPSDAPPEEVSEFGGQTPMQRPAQPEEIAPAYVFLASPHCSSYITGEILPIIGGY
jgi:NAD(P)-dependent dehydrogenase (short-subunit alcohol dehydrogenase family)